MADNKAKENVRNKNIAINRKARHEYIFLETYEAGIALIGTEVKSLRAGNLSMVDAYGTIADGELWLKNLNISHWEKGNRFNHDTVRPRKLLMHSREIKRIHSKITEKGLTLVPSRLYFKNGRVKVELALARGKKLYDKREADAEKSARREVERTVKNKEF